MKINGFTYTEEEILEALRQKGYMILPYKDYHERHIHGSTFEKEWYDTKCAVKGAEPPSEKKHLDKCRHQRISKRNKKTAAFVAVFVLNL